MGLSLSSGADVVFQEPTESYLYTLFSKVLALFFQCTQATYEDFVDFMEVEARIAMNPFYGRLIMGSGTTKSKLPGRRTEQKRIAKTPRGKLLTSNLAASAETSDKCLYCAQNHEVHACPELLGKTPVDKN